MSNARSHWERLWASGAVDSFGRSLVDLGRGSDETPLTGRWRAWFASLSDNCRLLDIGTGTGILLRHALDARPFDSGLRCVGIDAAALPANILGAFPDARVHQIAMQGRVQAESLPHENASFDAVVSQFGVEYADMPAALREIVRVLGPEGRVALLMHHREGRPVALAAAERDHAAWLLDAMLPAASAMAAAMSLLGTEKGRRELQSSPRRQEVRRRYDLALAQARQRRQDSIVPDLVIDVEHWCAEAFRIAAAKGTSAGEATITEVARRVCDHDSRLKDLLAHALDTEGAASVAKTLSEAGLHCSIPEAIEEAGHLMGWWVEAHAS